MLLQRQVFDPEPPVLHLERNSEAVSGDEVDRRRKPGEPSAAIRERVNKARAIQNQRYAASGLVCNAQMGQEELRTYCVLDEAGTALMRQAYDKMELTARSYDRILRLARTIADLAGAADIAPNHLAEALQYRTTGYLDE